MKYTKPPHIPSSSPPSRERSQGLVHPVLPAPPTFGLSEQFDKWRVGQDQAVQEIVLDENRFHIFVGPTGFGKSLVYVCAAVLSGMRTLILTSTNALSHQIMEDFGDLCVQVKGKANYRCRKIGHGVMCDRGPCNYRVPCSWKDSGCEYYDQVRKAGQAQIVVTNYAYWIYNLKSAQAGGENAEVLVGDFGLIVCDEAHDAPNKVADAFEVRFSTRNSVESYLMQDMEWEDDRRKFQAWASGALVEAQRVLGEAKRDAKIERAYQASNAVRKLRDALKICREQDESNVIIVPEKKWGVFRVAMAWPFDRAHDVLFSKAKKVVLTSATVRQKTVGMLGVDPEQCTLMEYPHIIPQHRRMLYHVPAVRMNFRTTELEMRQWMTVADQIMRPRVQWNGIFHSVSYARRNYVLSRSRHSELMMSHGRKDAQEVIERFKGERGRILVSPSVTTGYDFPYDTCRWQIIGKIAYPDTSDLVTKERCKRDEEYAPYVAMQTLVQTVGRIVRAEDDWGESFIIDDNAKWFLWKFAHFAPDWFNGSYKSVTGVPKPYGA